MTVLVSGGGVIVTEDVIVIGLFVEVTILVTVVGVSVDCEHPTLRVYSCLESAKCRCLSPSGPVQMRSNLAAELPWLHVASAPDAMVPSSRRHT